MTLLLTCALLTVSNFFMNVAWYGHLKFRDVPLPKVILIAWLIAFVEYCFQVPANRIGYSQLSAVQLKILQEVLSISTFALFSLLYLREAFRWNYLVSFVLVVGAVYFAFKK